MKRTLVVAAALTALAQPVLAQTQAHGAQALTEAVARAFEANDPDALAAAYATDAVLYPPGAMEQTGRAAIRQGFADLVARYRVADFAMSDMRYETAGDLSVGWGRFTASLAPRGGGAAILWEGRFTSVARRLKGKWLIVSSHASMPQPVGPVAPATPRGISTPAR
jgi:uncharacterized protein (TIGR02246 family)